jgi:hypothetical protein
LDASWLPVNVIVPLKLNPLGSVSPMVASATVGPPVIVAFTVQLNVPPLASGPERLLLFERARLGFTQPVTASVSVALVPPTICAVFVYVVQLANGKFVGAVTGTVIV